MNILTNNTTTRPDFERRSPERLEAARKIARTQVLINIACMVFGAAAAIAYMAGR